MYQEKPREYWLIEDRRREMEQVTFGERVQTYIAPDLVDGVQLLSAVSYLDAKGLTKISANYFALVFCQCAGPDELFARVPESLDTIIFHHYVPDRATIQEDVRLFEKRMVENLDMHLSAHLNPK